MDLVRTIRRGRPHRIGMFCVMETRREERVSSPSNRRPSKKRRSASDESNIGGITFCTRCAEELENFCFSPQAKDLRAIRKIVAECKKKGIFSGDLCAKLFIASSDESG
jgi:hypothetical protein